MKRKNYTVISSSINLALLKSLYIGRLNDGEYEIGISNNVITQQALQKINQYNKIEHYQYDIEYYEMPETSYANTITTNDGLIVSFIKVIRNSSEYIDIIIYDLFPNMLVDANLNADNYYSSNIENISFLRSNIQTRHSVVTKNEGGYYKPKFNVIARDDTNIYGTLDMDLPEKEFNSDYNLYKNATNILDHFYIKPKQYLYVSKGTPELITSNIKLIQITNNIYYVANITSEINLIEFKLKSSDSEDSIIEFL